MKKETVRLLAQELAEFVDKKDTTVKENSFVSGFIISLVISNGIETAAEVQASLEHDYYNRVMSIIEAVINDAENND